MLALHKNLNQERKISSLFEGELECWNTVLGVNAIHFPNISIFHCILRKLSLFDELVKKTFVDVSV